MKLPEKLRTQLKRPLGELIPDNEVTRESVFRLLPKKTYLITVGDATTEKMIRFDMLPSLHIIDNHEKREKRDLPTSEGIVTQLSCDNPAAEITDQSINVIKKAFESKPPVRIIVNGEEDLLVIPACIYAPENSVVMYGQPDKGLVVVRVDDEIRNKTQKLLDLME